MTGPKMISVCSGCGEKDVMHCCEGYAIQQIPAPVEIRELPGVNRPFKLWTTVEREAYERAMEDLHAEIECGQLGPTEVCDRLGALMSSWESKLEDPDWLKAQAAADAGDSLRKAGA